MFTTDINCIEWIRRRNLELQFQILSYPNDNNPMPRLWNTVSLEEIEVGKDIISCVEHSTQYGVEGLTFISRLKSANIFSKKPFRLKHLQRFNSILVQRPKRARYTFLLTNLAEIITRETECKTINIRYRFQSFKV